MTFDLGAETNVVKRRVRQVTDGIAVFPWDPGAYVDVGDLRIPPKILFRTGDGYEPRVTLGIEMRGTTPACTFVQFAASPSGVVRASDFKGVHLEKWVREIVSECSEELIDKTARTRLFASNATPTPTQREAVKRLQKRRTDPRNDPTLLRRVAELYKQHPDAPNKAVAAEFDVHERTAARWAQYASDAGLLPESTQQGRKRI